MKATTFHGTVESAYGKPLPKAVEFSGSYDAFENMTEVRSAKEELSDDEELAVINAKRKAASRAAATTAALDTAGYEKPKADDPAVITENMIKGMMKLHGLTREQAEAAFKLASEAATAVK